MSLEDTLRELARSNDTGGRNVIVVFGTAQDASTSATAWRVVLPDGGEVRVTRRIAGNAWAAGDRLLLVRAARGSWAILGKLLAPGETG